MLDRDPVLSRVAFDGWLAWALVKERLWHLALAPADRANAPGPGAASARLLSGLGQVARAAIAPHPAHRAVLYADRTIRLPDGTPIHPHLGRLLQGERMVLSWVYGSETASGAPMQGLHDWGLGAVVAAAARPLRLVPVVRRTAQALAAPVAALLPSIAIDAIDAVMTDQLARFRVRRRLSAWLYRRAGIREVVVTDPDAKTAEIAAARDLHLPVVEVQHGLFSRMEPDYGWTRAHREAGPPLPLPDRIVVQGPLFRDELTASGYWRDDEILVARNPPIAAYHAQVAARPTTRLGAPLAVLFPTQQYLRDAALSFWKAALSMQMVRGERHFTLRIKVHPLELEHAAIYRRLAEEFSEHCTVAPMEEDAFSELAAADLVAGYTSMMMLEGLGLGIPVVGIRGGAAPEGLCGTFGLARLADAIKDIFTPEQFLDYIDQLHDPAAFAAIRRRTLDTAAGVFATDGPDVDMAVDRAFAQ